MKHSFDHKRHLPGLDLLRITAAILIFAQHSLSVTGYDEFNVAVNRMIGRLGTALLFAMSGYLSVSSVRSPEQWLWKRLIRLYPAFWIVIAASFIGVWLTGRKEFDTLQVLCEFAGIGLFTHSIVLITVWFFSLIVLMTLLIYVAHRLGHVPVIGGAIATIIIGAHCTDANIAEYFSFAMIFILGYAMAVPESAAGRWLIPCVALGALAMHDLPSFRNLILSTVLLGLATRENWPTWRTASRFTPFAYEWFLSHGLCLQLVCLVSKNLWIVLPMTAALSIIVAILLQRLVAKIVPKR